MTGHQLFMNKTNYAIISKFEIELTIFNYEDGTKFDMPDTYIKDLRTNRCYGETATKNIKSDLETVKKRIKNSMFEEIMKTCVIAE